MRFKQTTATLTLALLTAQALADPHSFRPLVLEAEEFTSVTSGWLRKPWGENFYCSTFANTFLSRKAYLSAPKESKDAGASQTLEVPNDGEYLILTRYELPHQREALFKISIKQAGETVYEQLYGSKASDKIWPFLPKKARAPRPFYALPWGAAENIVWEGHNYRAQLKEGEATIQIESVAQGKDGTDRNVDLILLTQDEAEVTKRIREEKYLPLDGLLTQEGDLELEIENLGQNTLKAKIPPCREHSPYWVHLRDWKTINLTLEAGEKRKLEVGHLLDSLNDGDWKLEFAKPENYRLRFFSGGTLIREIESNQTIQYLAFDADTRYTKRIRTQAEVLNQLCDEVEALEPYANSPKQFPIFGIPPATRDHDDEYKQAVHRFRNLFPVQSRKEDSTYVDIRAKRTPEALKGFLKKQSQALQMVSLGDEIGLPAPGPDASLRFAEWLKKQKGLRTALVFNQSKKNPESFYASKRFLHDYGLKKLRERTSIVAAHSPKADTGANVSPHHGPLYLGKVALWVRAFREGVLTAPWSEDYIWQVPVGGQQMSFITLDLARAALRGTGRKRIIRYVMPHSPGNTPQSWRRQFYGSLAHGMTELDLFEFRPVQLAYTENYVNSPEMYAEIRRSLSELARFEGLVLDGELQSGTTGLWWSETGDIWGDDEAPFGAGKRSLYIMLRHLQRAVEPVTESDDLSQFETILITNRHLSSKETEKLRDWVKEGGRLVLTAGAGHLDQFNRPNLSLLELAGLEAGSLRDTEAIKFIKQDLPRSRELQSLNNDGMPLYGAIADLKPNKSTRVTKTFLDGSPALVQHQQDKGTVFTFAFLPGLSYFHSAIPDRPVDRGSRDYSMNHFIPEDFDTRALSLLEGTLKPVEQSFRLSDPLIDTGLIKANEASLLLLTRWRQSPRPVELQLSEEFSNYSVELASGTPASPLGNNRFRFSLKAADAVILRKKKGDH
jgi:hypothetical protein